jgi:hypothetical protein
MMAMPGVVRLSLVHHGALFNSCFIDFSHDQSRARTYRWGEDGIAGVSDTHGRFNIAFSFWNEKEYVHPTFNEAFY